MTHVAGATDTPDRERRPGVDWASRCASPRSSGPRISAASISGNKRWSSSRTGLPGQGASSMQRAGRRSCVSLHRQLAGPCTLQPRAHPALRAAGREGRTALPERGQRGGWPPARDVLSGGPRSLDPNARSPSSSSRPSSSSPSPGPTSTAASPAGEPAAMNLETSWGASWRCCSPPTSSTRWSAQNASEGRHDRSSAWLQIALFFALVLAHHQAAGRATCPASSRASAARCRACFGPVERLLYRLCGRRPERRSRPGCSTPARAAGLQPVQPAGHLRHPAAAAPAAAQPAGASGRWSRTLAFNTAASFTTNTNWQSYAGESTMSYLSPDGRAGLAQLHLRGGRASAWRWRSRAGSPGGRARARRRRWATSGWT